MLAPKSDFETALLSWSEQAVKQGLTILKKERAYNEISMAINSVTGQPLQPKARTISPLSSIYDNRIRKVTFEVVSALTSVRQIWNYETYNPLYKAQSEILSKLARAWWRNAEADRKLQQALFYSAVGGSGYIYLTWDAAKQDIVPIPYDPRDVLPISPVYTDSIQDWQGVILRRRVDPSEIKAINPAKYEAALADNTTWFDPQPEKETGGRTLQLMSAVWSALTTSGGAVTGVDPRNPRLVDLIHIFIKDDTLHTGNEPVTMSAGPGNEYTVYPVGAPKPDGSPATEADARLYPRGRLIICTPGAILKDGPNPYYHGKFPIVRFTMDPLPWTLLGASFVSELIPLQNSLNSALQGLEDGMNQWVRRGVVANTAAIGKNQLDAIDTRRGGMRALLNPAAGGDAFRVVDGPQFPDWYLQMLEYYKNEMDELSGVRGLQQLAQAKQVPSSDTIEKYMEAMSPVLQLRGRSIEVSLAELANLMKSNFFQFYTASKRMQILGKDGLALEDFDFDPATLIPADAPGKTEAERYTDHQMNFSFSVAPNSFLEVSHTTQKMLTLQLFRINAVDPWTMWDSMNVPSTGPAPAETVPERLIAARRMGLMQGPTPEMIAAQEKAAIASAETQTIQAKVAAAQMQMQMMQAAFTQPQGPGPGGPPPGMNGPPRPVGRPPSGQVPPRAITKNGPEGPRLVISESPS